MRLRFSLSLLGDMAVVRCVGAMVRGTETDRLSHTIHELLSKHANCVLVISDDCSIDAYGIGLLVRAVAEAKSHGRKFVVVCTEQRLLQLFELVGLNSELEIQPSETAALSALQVAA